MLEMLLWWMDESDNQSLSLFDRILSGLASLIEGIPSTDLLFNIWTYELPPDVAYFADCFLLDFGAGVIFSCFILRFLICRITFIG